MVSLIALQLTLLIWLKMVTGANEKRAKKTKSKRSQKAVADAAKIVEKRWWRLINFNEESFQRCLSVREKRHLCFNLRKGSRYATLLEIFLEFLPHDFISQITNNMPEIHLKYYNGWGLHLSLQKNYLILSVKICIYGGKSLPGGVKTRLRLQIQAVKSILKTNVPKKYGDFLAHFLIDSSYMDEMSNNFVRLSDILLQRLQGMKSCCAFLVRVILFVSYLASPIE